MTLDADINLFLLLDGAKLDAPRITYQHDDAPWADWLYRGTRHEAALAVSPYLVLPSAGSRLWEQQSAWAEGGILIRAKAGPEVLVEHLRSLISVRMPSGQLSYCRFYVGTHLDRFFQVLTEAERNLFSGPIVEWRNPRADACWQTITTSGVAEAKHSENEGWFQLSEPQIEAMNGTQGQSFLARLRSYLDLDEQRESQARLQRLVREAEEKGFHSERDIVRYAELALYHPQGLHSQACQVLLDDNAMTNFEKLDQLDRQLAQGGAA
ncbi:MAG: DUF4123 domain-containing protein [Marinobacter sp.]|uniref:DUF4123 domain-containing protein n=1 Tax=Marinobacter sp. TaxID=50741 RepID=UPI00299E0236|nr:DUF4123 domain-containing protein [Marinobacter sp.]MDX1636230.1 DUF4123 domain-containing protein [Marinobacter sp.]